MTLSSRAEALRALILDTEERVTELEAGGSSATERDIYRPALVMSPASVTAFGGSMVDGVSLTIAALAGSVPAGFDVLIWNGTAGAAANGSYTSDGAGNFAWADRQYLNATSVANGCVSVISADFVSADAAGDLSEWTIATANGTDWRLQAIGGYALSRAGIMADVYAADTRVDATDTRVDALEADALAIHDAFTAASYATDPPTAWFVGGNSDTDAAWTTGDIPELLNGPDMRALIRARRGAVEFAEVWSRFFDDGTVEDSPEFAVQWPSATASPRLYLESVHGGDTEDLLDVEADVDIEDVWVWVRAYIDLDNDLAVLQLGVRWGGDVTTADGRQWRTLASVARSPGIEWNVARDWNWLLRFYGEAARGELYDGVDGTLVAAPDAADWTTGLSFTDSEGVEWTTVSGTVQRSVDARLDTLEAAGAPLAVIESLGAQSAITNAGTWPGPVHTAVELPACAAGDLIDFDAVVEWVNNSGAVRRPTFSVTLGATTVAGSATTATIGTGLTRQFVISGRIHVLSPTSQRIAFTSVCENYDTIVGAAAAAEDMATAKNLTLNVGSNSATGDQTAQLLALHVRKITA